MRRTIELIAAAGTAALLTIAYLVYVARNIGPVEYADFSAALSVIYFFGVALSVIAVAPCPRLGVELCAAPSRWKKISLYGEP